MLKSFRALYRVVSLSFFYLVLTLLLPDARVYGQTHLSGGQTRIRTNVQSGTAYTILASDCGKLVSFSNASPIAVTLPQAGPAGLAEGCWMDVQNVGSGAVILTPVTSLIDQAGSLQLTTNQGLRLVSTGAGYLTQRGQGSGTGGGTGTGSGTVTDTVGALVAGAIVTGNGGADIKTSVPAATMDNSGNVSIPGTLTTNTACTNCAGALDLMPGNDPGAGQPPNSFSWIAPQSIGSSFRWKLPSADAAGAIVSDGAATPGTLSMVPFSGTDKIVRAISPTLTTATLTQPIITNYRVGTLPAGVTSGKLAYVTDGATSADCTTGGGVNKVACIWDGSQWAFPGPKASDGGTSSIGSTSVIGYEIGAEDAASPLATADLTAHSLWINDANAKTLTEASCISDAGSQVVTLKTGTTTVFTITCVAYGSYSAATADGSTGYINTANMSSSGVGAHVQLDLSGVANGSTKDVKLRVYAAVN